MFNPKRLLSLALIALMPLIPLWPAVARATALTSTELTWLEIALPVLSFGRAQGLPLDILVRPRAEPGDTPLGMAWVDGRCKLVLSMRGNPEAQATLDRIEPVLRGPVVEAIAAHELGHCWRHVRQTWGTLPSGHAPSPVLQRLPPDQSALLDEMWTTRREEAYADLVGLAWTLRYNADVYPAVHAWLVKLRQEQTVDTGPHDTRLWVALAKDIGRFSKEGVIFDQIEGLWATGLRASP